MDKICQVIDINISKFEITMKFKMKMSNPIPLITIKTNDDMELFLDKIASGMKFRNLLCVTFKCKKVQ